MWKKLLGFDLNMCGSFIAAGKKANVMTCIVRQELGEVWHPLCLCSTGWTRYKTVFIYKYEFETVLTAFWRTLFFTHAQNISISTQFPCTDITF